MGGTLSMASVDQQGSCFHCLLPLQPCLDEEQTKGTARPIDGSSLRSGLRILLVDDNEVSRELAGMMLEPSHLVTIAANGIEALVKLAFDRFDLVLMDVQMPVLDGLGATALIRTLEADRPMDIRLPQHVEQLLRQKLAGGHLPIVAMTAHALGGDEEICLSSGMDDYLAKPFDATQLVQVLERVIRTRPLKQPAPQPKPL
jgi:CheY-like chemotaxis protein